MSLYHISLSRDVLQINFGNTKNATQQEIIKEVYDRIAEMASQGEFGPVGRGGVLYVRGPASFATASTMLGVLLQYYKVIASFDRDEGYYIVTVSNDPGYQVSQIITE